MLVGALIEPYANGRVFDRRILAEDAIYNFDEFGYYGLSLWLSGGPWSLERLLKEKTRKASRVALFTAADLVEHDLTPIASGRAPHYDVTDGRLISGDSGIVRVTAGSAEQLVDAFIATPYTVLQNRFFEQDIR